MSEKITFKELVKLISKQSEQSESSANSFIHELVQIIEGGLKQTGSVSISGFGKFELRWMKERPGVNPQTGDEITIPGQNKVFFKPFKALRETVNKPFSNLEAEVLSETVESKEESGDTKETESGENDPFGLKGVFGSDDDDPFDSEDPFDSDAPFDSNDPFEGEEEDSDQSNEEGADEDLEEDFDFDEEIFGAEEPDVKPVPSEDKDSIDDLIIERENPHFAKRQEAETVIKTEKKTVVAETETAILEAPEEEKQEESKSLPVKAEEEPKPQKKEKQEKVAPIIEDESKMAKKVQESGSFKWSYAAAVIIVMIALIILFLMMQQSDEPVEQTPVASGDQTEQVIEQEQQPSAGDETASPENTDASQQPQETVDEESPPSSGGSPPPDNELETETYTVQSGQSLWDIAESQLGNPYLWPVIYHLNEGSFDNPNQLTANADIEIPTFSDPDNLSEFQREQVALGYFSLYQWNRQNNPDEARNFLWAVGVFSQDMLDNPPSEVNSEDLAFARNR